MTLLVGRTKVSSKAPVKCRCTQPGRIRWIWAAWRIKRRIEEIRERLIANFDLLMIIKTKRLGLEKTVSIKNLGQRSG